ncbi:hypothetical protein [Bradyrhizobium sp. Ai1a-2]|uniref:hypothetical protein n=1 Tax=Bradyrhizobium sp. Ai1a-2 TaxID=196490 RepID=UPI001FCB3035|nr:hypothetical protein [Bradyrhizobium sp. Ai1a-2]
MLVSTLIVFTLPLAANAGAFDLTGAWAGDADNCAKVFARKGGQITFADNSDVYGSGFIVDGDQIIGKFVRCRIKATKVDGPNINLIAACASDIMLSSVQLSAKEVDADTLLRLFPGMEGMEIRYYRCRSQ